MKTIYKILIEISKANNISPKETIDQFFKDLDEYDNIVSFKNRVKDLQKEVATLTLQINSNRITRMAQQHMGGIFQNLLRKGISEKDIESINSIVSLGEFEYSDDDNNKIVVNKSH